MALALSIAQSGDLGAELRDLAPRLRAAHLSAVAKVGESLKEQLRADLRAAGIKRGATRSRGQDITKIWGNRLYPNPDRASPTAFVYARAPRIIEWLAHGPIVKAANGTYLAIPLPNAVARGLDRMFRARLAGGGLRLGKYADLGGLKALFGGKVKSIKLRDGSILLAVATDDYTGRGFKARRAKRSEKTGIVPLFLLVRQVAGRVRITPDATAQRFYDLLPEIVLAELDHAGATAG